MIEVERSIFERMMADIIDAIPEKYAKSLSNVAFILEDEPSPEQRSNLGLHNNQLLFGLYEGIPLPARGGSNGTLLPDKITLFQKHIEAVCHTLEEVREQIKKTIWHEVAHYFGLDHTRIYELGG